MSNEKVKVYNENEIEDTPEGETQVSEGVTL